MKKITINHKNYDLDQLPEEAKKHLASIQHVDSEIARREADLAVYKTARGAYLQALINSLPPDCPAQLDQIDHDLIQILKKRMNEAEKVVNRSYPPLKKRHFR